MEFNNALRKPATTSWTILLDSKTYLSCMIMNILQSSGIDFLPEYSF